MAKYITKEHSYTINFLANFKSKKQEELFDKDLLFVIQELFLKYSKLKNKIQYGGIKDNKYTITPVKVEKGSTKE